MTRRIMEDRMMQDSRSIAAAIVTAAARRSLGREAAISAVFFLVACHFALNSVRGTFFLKLEDYTSLNANLPYQYRVLMAPVFRILLPLFGRIGGQQIFAHLLGYLADPAALAYCAVNAVSFFIAIEAFRRIAAELFRRPLHRLFAYIILLLNPNLSFVLPYDLPPLAFTQLGVVSIMRRRFAALEALVRGKLSEHIEWPHTFIAGSAVFLAAAVMTEYRAFGDLIGFGALTVTLMLDRLEWRPLPLT